MVFDASGREEVGLQPKQLRARAQYTDDQLAAGLMPAPRGVTLAEKMPTLARVLPRALTRSIDESMMENRYGPPYTRKPEINEMMLEEINSHRASWREVCRDARARARAPESTVARVVRAPPADARG